MCICRNGNLQARNEGCNVVICIFMNHRTCNDFVRIKDAYVELTGNNCGPNNEWPFWNYDGAEAQNQCPLFE